MPLIQSATDEARARNIRTLMREGRPKAQALAIAYSVQRKAEKSKKTPALTTRGPRDNIAHMARKKSRRSSHSKAIVRHSAPSRGRALARRAVGAVSAEKHRTGALLVAAGLGFAKKQGYTVPHLEVAGEAGTIALAAYAAKKFGLMRSPWLDHLITGAGVIAVYDAISTGNIPLLSETTKAKKTKTEGRDFHTTGEEIDGGYDVR